MAKMGNYFFIMVGIMLLMHFAGLIPQTNNLIGALLSPEGFTYSNLWSNIVEALLAVGAAAVSVVLLISGKPDLAAATVVTTAYAELLYTFVLVYVNLANVSGIAGLLALILMSPLIIGMAFGLFEYWRGITT